MAVLLSHGCHAVGYSELCFCEYFGKSYVIKVTKGNNIIQGTHHAKHSKIMKTSCYENVFHITGHLWGNPPPVMSGFPSQRSSNTELWCFFVLSLNKLLNKQSSCWWFERPWSSCDISVTDGCHWMWQHYSDIGKNYIMTGTAEDCLPKGQPKLLPIRQANKHSQWDGLAG